jgi:hypothetical protein
MVPHLIGFHMSIDSWRNQRERDGWRLLRSIITRGKQGRWDDVDASAQAPATVEAVPRLAEDIRAIQYLMRSEVPALKRVHCGVTGKVYYGFGDASGPGFGASFQFGDELCYEYDQWCSEVSESKSSNWPELNNLVQALKNILKKYKLKGCEIFIFTDNTTAEAAFWKGLAKSKKLFALILELKMIEMENDLILHVVHVSGKRLIRQGNDGMSRADHSQGVMTGASMESFIPLYQSALERDTHLEKWLADVTRGLVFQVLDPSGWFSTAHSQGNSIWIPPPVAADVVMEQLSNARHKRPEAMHIVVLPRLMT